MTKPIPIMLSICIPTYNRVAELELTLDSITNQDIFKKTNLVEIVISDNCSTDNTEELVKKYVNIFGTKVVYNKNIENLSLDNFDIVLGLASGSYLKMNNDTLVHDKNSLELMLSNIEKYMGTGVVPLFSNANIKQKIYTDINKFVSDFSNELTWIGFFGIWRDDLNRIDPMSSHVDTVIPHTYLMLQYIKIVDIAVVSGRYAYSLMTAKGGYDLAEVFVINYKAMLQEHHINDLVVKQAQKKSMFGMVTSGIALKILKPKKYTFKIDAYRMALNDVFRKNFIYVMLFYFLIVGKLLKHKLSRS
jgi:abequosyltransferase